jgi:hypothetical protein
LVASGGHRADDGGDGYVTRQELNDALNKLANTQKEGQKQQTCDLVAALDDRIKKVIAEGPNGPGAALPPKREPVRTNPYAPFTRPVGDTRGADGDDYARNAYGDEYRDAPGDDEYTRNAYGDFDGEARNAHYGDEEYIRNAEEEYARNAYGDEYRDAYGDDEYARNAYGDEYRDAPGDEYRDAPGDEYRDAYGDDERNAFVDEAA